jgi:hypothetical protein
VESGQYERNTGRLPDWWDKKPPEVRGDDFYIRAFWELSSCRQFGQFVGPIPWDKIVAYGERKRLDSAMIDVLEVVIRELDEVYLSDLRENRRRQTETTSPKPEPEDG